ncbi:glycosyl hydrolase family 61 [Colletotrichum higginsianum IMI 349063]|uniref:lytic cellulose monooxygenase (C4-dehydrogenating) n=2 Tax=Colletotrichum higginsianum (strain IMI 349063) TaxID=759273 RepID=A0A1B7YG31_COLHI|nr:glycosyl hydrolase family 61 [Colletotrichum higginsianum IMI 349063]OBR11029.1 glycosyl hydrolase family 61 [Colletotrichum higginsianum IMI 349063]GJD01255.1 glycosyl hydrolase family 61 [Colletotrichum higginsianum]
MKISAVVLGLAVSVSGHAIFQKLSVNGVDQGALKGVRATSSNNPIQNVNDGGFACNNNIQYKDSNVISVPAGAKVGAWWGHVIGGPQGSNDPDHPIAASHKGPIIAYLAKVDNAASTGTAGLKWFKAAEAGLSGSTWAVDTMIANGGWHYFTLPSCVAPGDYLLRVELIALHGASVQGEAQFYMGCAQIRVTGSGNNAGSSFVSFPGAYSASHPGILVSIYDNTGRPTNGGRPYSIPGPAVISCSGGSGGSGGGGSPPPTSSSPPPTSSAPSNSGGSGAPLYGQCGGKGWTGATTCATGTCKVSNEHYSQCLP